jgi:hypothetical protein
METVEESWTVKSMIYVVFVDLVDAAPRMELAHTNFSSIFECSTHTGHVKWVMSFLGPFLRRQPLMLLCSYSF